MLKRIKDITEIEADMICSSQNNNCDNCPLYEWHSKECMVRLMNQKINVFLFYLNDCHQHPGYPYLIYSAGKS